MGLIGLIRQIGLIDLREILSVDAGWVVAVWRLF